MASLVAQLVKESACNEGAHSSIPRSGSTAGERIGCPLQDSWVILVAQMVRNPPVMWDTWVQSWVEKMPWRRAWQPTAVFLHGEYPGQRSLLGHDPWDRKSQT